MHGQDAQCFEIDQHLALILVDADLGEGHARGTDPAGGIGQQFDRHPAREHPTPTAGLPRCRQLGVGRQASAPPRRRRRPARPLVERRPSINDDAAARTAMSTRTSRSRASSARSRRSVMTCSGGGSGSRARGSAARSRRWRRAARSASTPVESNAASPSPIGDGDGRRSVGAHVIAARRLRHRGRGVGGFAGVGGVAGGGAVVELGDGRGRWRWWSTAPGATRWRGDRRYGSVGGGSGVPSAEGAGTASVQEAAVAAAQPTGGVPMAGSTICSPGKIRSGSSTTARLAGIT